MPERNVPSVIQPARVSESGLAIAFSIDNQKSVTAISCSSWNHRGSRIHWIPLSRSSCSNLRNREGVLGPEHVFILQGRVVQAYFIQVRAGKYADKLGEVVSKCIATLPPRVGPKDRAGTIMIGILACFSPN